jgi:hypothetical protein
VFSGEPAKEGRLLMSVSLERLAHNQVLFREVNERLREMLDESVAVAEFLCECSQADCTETLPLEPSEYERVRSQPNQFVITPGHEIPEIEEVVWESDSYILLRKIEGAEYAERTDPRSRGEG